jgi:hypothetical protein
VAGIHHFGSPDRDDRLLSRADAERTFVLGGLGLILQRFELGSFPKR